MTKKKVYEILRCKGFPDVRHVDCGGTIAVGGEGHVEVFDGCGFSGSQFVVDRRKCPAYFGFCMKCHKEGAFVRIDKKAKMVRRPHKLGQKNDVA